VDEHDELQHPDDAVEDLEISEEDAADVEGGALDLKLQRTIKYQDVSIKFQDPSIKFDKLNP
jgi:hypothetical protein